VGLLAEMLRLDVECADKDGARRARLDKTAAAQR
jgi:hypothetical protein